MNTLAKYLIKSDGVLDSKRLVGILMLVFVVGMVGGFLFWQHQSNSIATNKILPELLAGVTPPRDGKITKNDYINWLEQAFKLERLQHAIDVMNVPVQQQK